MSGLPHSLYRAAQVRELDRRAIEEAGIDGFTLMTRAGAAVFAELRRHWPAAHRVVVLCGVGNNGGDGFVIARLAREAGLEVQVLQLGDPGRIGGAAATAREAWLDTGGRVEPFDGSLPTGAEVFVDALFGTGLERAVEGPWREAIELLNQHAAPVLAVDIPSGLHADTGAVLGVAVAADWTVTFIGLKQGQFTGQGPEYCGVLVFDGLEVPAEVYLSALPSASRISHDLLPRLLPARPRTCHKGDCGHVLVVGGDHGMAGAVRMAAEAAARAGAGLVTVATRPDHVGAVVAARPELMVHGVSEAAGLQPLLERADVVAVGPGLGRSHWSLELFAAVLDRGGPLVVDADGLNLLAAEPLRRDDWVLTPHPGEAARLLGCATSVIQADRFAAVEALADAFGGVSVLKGAGTLVRAAEGHTYVSDAGNPGMASGGMGDVLTGIIAGLLAQGLDPEDAARAGVYLHGAAADRAAADGERGLLAGDVIATLRPLVNPQPPHGR